MDAGLSLFLDPASPFRAPEKKTAGGKTKIQPRETPFASQH